MTCTAASTTCRSAAARGWSCRRMPWGDAWTRNLAGSPASPAWCPHPLRTAIQPGGSPVRGASGGWSLLVAGTRGSTGGWWRMRGPDAGGRSVHRRLRAVRRRARGAGHDRGYQPAAAGSARQRRSAADDSFGGGADPMAGLLEGPSYTRPRGWRGREVPAVLLSGHTARSRVAPRRGAAAHRRAPSRSRRGAAGPGPARPAGLAEAGWSAEEAPGWLSGSAKEWHTEVRYLFKAAAGGALVPWPRRQELDAGPWRSATTTEEISVMHTAIAEMEQAQIRSDIPDFRPGTR